MSSFDLTRSLRRFRAQRATKSLTRRSDGDLVFATGDMGIGGYLLLDTTVYVDRFAGRMPVAAKQLLADRTLNHSAVAVGELAYGFGRLDPNHRDTAAILELYTELIGAIPEHRLHAPSRQTVIDASILAGLVARLRGASPDRQLLVNDALIFLQALDLGIPVLTRNIADFDMLQQIVPQGQAIFYRQLE